MPRTGLRSCAAVVVVLASGLVVLAGDDRDRFRDTLAVHVALEQGLQLIQRGQFAEAVAVLEKQISSIDGNRRYLTALRDAYRGHVKALLAAGRHSEARRYQGRLEILEPVAPLERPAPPPAPLVREEKAPPPPASAVSRGPAPTRGITPRGVPAEEPDEGDPFSEGNRARPTGLAGQRARGLVERADRAYDQKQYELAAQLYGQAHRLAPDRVADCRAQWGYCRLFAVGQAVNRGAVERRGELEREVRAALALAPQLDALARSILARLEEPGGGNVSVRHTPRQGSGWAIAQTTNFKVYHTTTEESAEKVARVAEATRLAMTRKWFGEMPGDWSPACVIYLYATGQGYARATGKSPSAPGHSDYKLEDGRVVYRHIHLPLDNPNMLTSVLPHETTHIVLVGRFGHHYVPRWADEGMAVLSEPRERINLHLRNLPRHQKEGTLFSLRELLAQSDYPSDGRRMGPFYAQGVSLVDFLCQKKDAATFARFLREALDRSYPRALDRYRASGRNDPRMLEGYLTEELEGGGYERALQRYYGYRTLTDLEGEWKQFAFGPGTVVSASEKR